MALRCSYPAPFESAQPGRDAAHASIIPEVPTSIPVLDQWLASPAIRVTHRRQSGASPDRLWDAARSVRLNDTRMLGRLIRWRIPGLPSDIAFDELFREPPFTVLVDNGDRALVSGMVGRIWTLRRDYPEIHGPVEFQEWAAPGTAKVVFANWVEEADGGGSALTSETRVQALGAQGRVGVAAVRPLVAAFGNLVGTDALAAAVRQAEDA